MGETALATKLPPPGPRPGASASSCEAAGWRRAAAGEREVGNEGGRGGGGGALRCVVPALGRAAVGGRARLPVATGKVVVVNGVAPKPVGCERILEHAAPTCDDGAGPCSAVGLRLVRTGPHASQHCDQEHSTSSSSVGVQTGRWRSNQRVAPPRRSDRQKRERQGTGGGGAAVKMKPPPTPSVHQETDVQGSRSDRKVALAIQRRSRIRAAAPCRVRMTSAKSFASLTQSSYP